MLDIKIVNGTVVDGRGKPGFAADVGIRDGRIVAIGEVTEDAAEVVDAKGQVVCPGFVDTHTHYDAQLFWDPDVTPSCFHGVTTILAGNCGFSIAPLTKDSAEYLLPMLARVEGMPQASLEEGVPWNWDSFGSYLERLDNTLGINAGFFVGHSAIRRAVMGPRAVGSEATGEELAAMCDLLDKSLDEGALGLSTTVSRSHNDADGNPVPSRHASRDEFLSLASVVGKYEGTSLELLPNLDFDDDMKELMADFSLAARRPVNWNVLSIADASEHSKAEAERMLAVSDYARRKGGAVIALVFVAPPTMRLNFVSGFVLDSLYGWEELFKLPAIDRIEKLKDPEYRRRLDENAKSEKAGVFRQMSDWHNWIVAETFSPETAQFKGRRVKDIAEELGKLPFDAMIDVVVADGLKTSLLRKSGKEDKASYELRAQVWKDDRTVVGASDAGAHMDMIDAFAFSTKLLQTGVREHQVISLEDAIHELTEVPAKMMGLRERGVIREGWHADIVVFDPATVGLSDIYTRFDLPADEGRLYADAHGISRVIVNGRTIVKDGEHTGAKPGKVIRSGVDTYTNELEPVAA